jgi:hypothetical protein
MWHNLGNKQEVGKAMDIYQPLDALPMWVDLLLTLAVLLLAYEAGLRLGKLIQERRPDQSEAGVGVLVGAALALLGFLLAVTTSSGVGLFRDRRLLVIEEANAIGTTYLRAGYLAEPYGPESRQLLREYTEQRLAALDPALRSAAIARSEQIHGELWSRAEAVARKDPSPVTSLYLSALNETIDLHTKRLSAELGIRVPPVVLFSLYGVAVLSLMLVGVYTSYRDRPNRAAEILLVLVLSLVFMLIVDLDRAQEGLFRVPMQALLDLQRTLNAAP